MAETILQIAVVLIFCSIVFGVLRLVIGRTAIDRVVAIDMLTVVAISLIVPVAFWGLLIGVLIAYKVLKGISPYGGVVLKTLLDETKEQVLRDALQKATAAG